MPKCVYRHTAPDGRIYIGIAQEPAKIRWADGKGYKDNPVFWACICEVGWANITHEILASGLDSREARELESQLITEYNTLYPNGFNRRLDDGRSYRRKKEIGRKCGCGTVVDYWPDEDGFKVYLLECECGKKFRCHWFDLTDDTNCGCRDNDSEGGSLNENPRSQN